MGISTRLLLVVLEMLTTKNKVFYFLVMALIVANYAPGSYHSRSSMISLRSRITTCLRIGMSISPGPGVTRRRFMSQKVESSLWRLDTSVELRLDDGDGICC